MILLKHFESFLNSGKGTTPTTIKLSSDTLLDLYKIAVDEYRFQVTLNWNRTQYYLAFNVGLLGVATGLLQLVSPPLTWVAAGLYAAGGLCCVLSLIASRVQQQYYRNTRDRMKEIERLVGIQEFGITTTQSMGGPLGRFGRVTTIIRMVLIILCVLDVLGAAIAIVRPFIN